MKGLRLSSETGGNSSNGMQSPRSGFYRLFPKTRMPSNEGFGGWYRFQSIGVLFFSRLLQGQHSAILLAFQIVSTAALLIITVSFCKFLTDPGIEQTGNHSENP